MSMRINAAIEPAAKTAAHIPALNIPAMAEHPATKSNTHAVINSANGFIRSSFTSTTKKLCRNFFSERNYCETRMAV